MINTIFGLLGGLLGIAFFGRPAAPGNAAEVTQPPFDLPTQDTADDEDVVVEEEPAAPSSGANRIEPPEPEDRENDKPDDTPLQ